MYSQNPNFDVPSSIKVNPEQKKRWYKHWWGKLIIVFFAIFFAVLIAMLIYVGRVVTLLRSGQIAPENLFGGDFSPNQLSNLETLATDDDPSLGPRDAKVVIVEFGDFQCPFCKQAMPVVKEILKDYGDKILFIYRDFPLIDVHPQALIAAVAGECADEQGKFWEMHDKIFDNQAEINEFNLKTYAAQIGLNNVQFGECYASGKYLKEIEEDLVAGYEAGVRATPTFFINGSMVAGVIPLSTFEQIILYELSR